MKISGVREVPKLKDYSEPFMGEFLLCLSGLRNRLVEFPLESVVNDSN